MVPVNITNLVFVILILLTIKCTVESTLERTHPRRIDSLIGNQNHRSPRAVPEQEKDVKNESIPEPKKISSKIKYNPFQLPPFYNHLQIPSSRYVAAQAEGYKSEELEALETESQPITVTMRIGYVTDVDELNEEVTFAVHLILQWRDEVISLDAMHRLGLSQEVTSSETNNLFKTLDPDFLKQIWKPDIFIENLVKTEHPQVMSQPVTVRLNEVTGQIAYVSRLRIKMECEMDFHYYPADTQTCFVLLHSNSHAKDELTLRWGKPFGAFLDYCGHPNFDFQLTSVSQDTKREDYIGNMTREFSVLKFNLTARRKLSYHVVQTFLPSVFFIIITWLCFLVPAEMVEARIGISMTTLLTLTAMFSSVRESTPTVSYVRAIDIWMLACIFFVFLTLLEFTVLLWLRRRKEVDTEDGKSENEIHNADMGATAIEFQPLNSRTQNTKGIASGNRAKGRNRIKSRALEFIEKYAFLMFSAMFVSFCAIFWGWLLIGAEYFVWDVNRDFNCAEG